MRDIGKQRKAQREWLRRRRASYESGNVCAKCGASGRLELDHIDPATKVHHAIWSWSKERLEAELAKCQWLCRPCHQEKSIVDVGNEPRQHGTYAMYLKRRCRCALCRAANADRARRQRRQKKERAAMAASCAA